MTGWLANPVLLAPMAGVNDLVFRALCKRMGAGLTYTEMVSAKGLSYGNGKTRDLLAFLDAEKPVAVQLFGSDPKVLAQQAQALERGHAGDLAGIDINMGCPARKIAGRGEGAALMRDPALAARILEAVVGAVTLPVTVKFRKGYGLEDNTAVSFARMAEGCGVAAVAVHGRTAQQFYHGESDKGLIARVKEAVGIPVIASGDVFTPQDVKEYLTVYGADGVMVARGAQGNPWLFAQARALLAGDEHAAYAPVPLEERVRIANEHTTELARLNPHRIVSMRKHVSWYFKGAPHASAIRRAAHGCTTLLDYQALFEQILAWR